MRRIYLQEGARALRLLTAPSPSPALIPVRHASKKSSPAAVTHKRTATFKQSLYDDPDNRPDEQFLISRLRTVLHPPSTSKRPAKPDPSQVVDALAPFLQDEALQKLLTPHAKDIAKAISHSSKAAEVLSLCFVLCANDSEADIETVAQEYASFLLTLDETEAYNLLQHSLSQYQSLSPVHRIPVPLVAAYVVLRSKLGITTKTTHHTLLPSPEAVGAYLGSSHGNSIQQLYDSPSDLPPTPELLQAHLSKLIAEGNEQGVMDAWASFRDHTDQQPGSLFDPAVRPRVLFHFLYALKAPRFGDSFPHLVDQLEQSSQQVLALIPRPYPREVLHCLMANRARVSSPPSGDPDNPTPPMTAKQIGLRNMHDIWTMAWEKGAERDVKLYMIYLEALGRLGDLETLQSVWDQLIQDDLCAAIYHKEGGDPRGGLTFPPTEALNQMIASAILIPRFGPDRAMELFHQACQPNSSVRCNITTINTVLRFYARRADIPGMQKLFSLADSLQLKPDLITYTTLVQGLLRAGRLDMAKATMESMHAQGLEPNERMCTLLIADLAKDGRRVGMQHAEELMREMKIRGFEVGVHAWTALISGYFRGGWVDDGWDAVRRMEETGTRLNRVSFNVILRQAGFKIEQDVASAERGIQPITLRLFQKMVNDGERPNADTYTIVLIPLVKARLWSQAEQVVEIMNTLKFSPEKSTLRELLQKIKYRRDSNRT